MRGLAIGLFVFGGGCSWFGALPYRFESPAQSGARILNDDQLQADVVARRAHMASSTPTRGHDRAGGYAASTGAPSSIAASEIGSNAPGMTAPAATTPGGASAAWSADGVVISRLPDPRQTAAPGPAIVPRTADGLRDLVGTRRPEDPLAFAVDAASAITERPAPPIAFAEPGPVTTPDAPASSGDALVGWLEAKAAGIDPSVVRAGDLLVFDRAVGDRPASLVAVAVARDERGVIEMIYLAAGIVRRGFVDPAMPNVARDRTTRRVRNTYLRHGRDWPPSGTRFLAGQLLKSAYRLP